VIGLIHEHKYRRSCEVVYILAGQARGAVILGCSKVGRRGIVKAVNLVKNGWRGYVWGGYLATASGLISQKTKEEITGISERT
jgi:predicted DNA-binding transcriptional regulator